MAFPLSSPVNSPTAPHLPCPISKAPRVSRSSEALVALNVQNDGLTGFNDHHSLGSDIAHNYPSGGSSDNFPKADAVPKNDPKDGSARSPDRGIPSNGSSRCFTGIFHIPQHVRAGHQGLL
jgi:hypothetical protein